MTRPVVTCTAWAQEAEVDAQDWRRLALNPWMFLALGAVLNGALQIKVHGRKVVWWFLPWQ